MGFGDENFAIGLSADGTGNVFVSGVTYFSLDPSDPDPGGYYGRAFVSKYKPDSSDLHLQWTRQQIIGDETYSNAAFADRFGNVYVSGGAEYYVDGEEDFDREGFVTKYDANGDRKWTVKLGPELLTSTSGVSADGFGNVYVAGATQESLDGPNRGGSDAFVAKIVDGDFQPPQPKVHVLGIGIRDTLKDVNKHIAADSGKRVAESFGLFPNVVQSSLELDDSSSENWAVIERAIETIRADMNPGDKFIFYINTHGGYTGFGDTPFSPTGDEAPVLAQNNKVNLDDRDFSTGDEYLRLYGTGGDGRITDDQFAGIFNNERWGEIDKLFIVDACYSGGFWNTDTSTGDSGDLTSLSRTALFAAATEANYSWNADFFGTDEVYGVLGVALQEVLAEKAGGIIQFESLVPLVQQRFNEYMTALINGQQIQGNPGLGGTFNNNITSLFVSAFDESNAGAAVDPAVVSLEPLVLIKSNDFDLTLGVPEPATIGMSICVAAFLFGFASRTRRE